MGVNIECKIEVGKNESSHQPQGVGISFAGTGEK